MLQTTATGSFSAKLSQRSLPPVKSRSSHSKLSIINSKLLPLAEARGLK